jgi:hypothetical protein
MRVFGNESFRGLSVYFGSLVHNSARGDALTIARHRSFIASRLLGGLLALCVFPIYLVVGGNRRFLAPPPSYGCCRPSPSPSFFRAPAVLGRHI